MVQKATHKLESVKTACDRALAGEDSVLFTAPTRSLFQIIETFCCSVPEAKRICIEGIRSLEPSDFSHSLFQWDAVADVYGLQNYQGFDWYVKFILDKDECGELLESISFHRPEKDLKLVDGRILKAKGGEK